MRLITLYNQDHQEIHPKSYAACIFLQEDDQQTVENELQDIHAELAKLTGSDSATDNIVVKHYYTFSNYQNKEDIKNNVQNDEWFEDFHLPINGELYVWRKTEYTYKGNTNEVNTSYEIVYADVAKETQTIYAASSDSYIPTINYPILRDGYGNPILDSNGNEQEDLAAFDDSIPEGWKDSPIEISSKNVNVYMATRKKVNGEWERYSSPAQYGKWPLNSVLETRYQVSESQPDFNAKSEDPGSAWKSTITEGSGKIWMITASSVNEVLNKDKNDIIWKGPILIGVL